MSMTPEQQIAVIKARAEGKEVEFKAAGYPWMTSTDDFDFCRCNYRVAKKPDVAIERQVIQESGNCIWIGSSTNSNLKLTFDGETGKLKSVEVL